MRTQTLPALAAAAYWTLALLPASALVPPKPAAKKPAASTSASTAVPGAAEVVGSVNGTPITWGQVITRLEAQNKQQFLASMAYAASLKATKDKFGLASSQPTFTITRAEAFEILRENHPKPIQDVMNQLVAQESVRQQMAKLNVAALTIPQADERLSRFLTTVRKDPRAGFQPGESDDAFLKRLKIVRAALVQEMRPQFDTYNLIGKDLENQLKHPVGAGDFIWVRHILIQTTPASPSPFAAAPKPEDTAKVDADALAKIKQIREDIVSGKKKFEDAAKESSQDPGSKDKGGDLGPFVRKTMYPEFEEAAFKLKPGEISEPVKTPAGYHIIQVVKLGKDLTETERAAALDAYEQNPDRFNNFVTTLVKSQTIVNKLTPPQQGMVLPRGAQGAQE